MIRRDSTSSSSSGALMVWRRWGGYAIGATILIVLTAVVWYLLADTASTKREVSTPPMLMLPPPPPPPPEPEKLPEPEPDPVEPEVIPDPTPSPVDTPDDAPPAPTPGEAVTIDGAAQAGTDAFGIAAGRGNGMTGTGGGVGSYASYLAQGFQTALQRDPRTRTLAFDDIRYNVWLDANGKTTRVELIKSSGNPATDEAVLAVIREFDSNTPPSASQRFPVRITSKSRRPG